MNEPSPRIAKVDFHLHSYASNVTTYYAANAFSIPESWSDPLKLYAALKQRGMSLVTLTDHNSIDGALLMLDKGYRDVFLSSELTCTFPEDGCHIHLTVANVTQAQFKEANRLRKNVYELVAWLEDQVAQESTRPEGNKIAWFMTHPLMSTENRAYGREGSLSLAHLEKMLLLLHGFEVQNGARTRALNTLTGQFIGAMSRLKLEEMANRHDLKPCGGEQPWKKFVVAGSDDHAGINPGRTWTEFPVAGAEPTANELVEAMRARATHPNGIHGGPVTLAHSLLKLVYDGSKVAHGPDTRAVSARPRSTPTVSLSGPLNALLELVFDTDAQWLPQKVWFAWKSAYHQVTRQQKRALGVPFDRVLESEIYRLLSESDFRLGLKDPKLTTDDRIFRVISTLINRIFERYVENLKRHASGNLIGVVKELVALASSNLFVSLPYLVSYLQQASDSLISKDVRKAFDLRAHQKQVLLTDTYFEINGVSATIKRMLREAIKRDIDFTVVTCLGAADQPRLLADPETRSFIEQGRLKVFTSVAEMDFPEYDGLKVRFPPLLELLQYMQESGFTRVQLSTPGTIGLTGLVAAKTLQLEIAATYHTSIPEYVENYTRDLMLEDIAWKYMLVFYHAVDEVLVPSRFIARLLHKRGLRNRKLLILDRWVDVERFHPGRRTPGYWAQRGIAEHLVKFVYVGRVGVEKNLALLAQAFRALVHGGAPAHLVIIGDGPYRKELEKQLAGLPVTFTGFLEGEELPRALASCDVKLFPSTTDTWGNAPLEAQACGLPVIVSEVGGPPELMEDGVTGLKVTGRDVEGLTRAMQQLLDAGERTRMGQAARAFSEANRIDRPFTAIFDSEGYRQRVAEAQARAEAGQSRVPLTTQVLDLTHASFEALLEGTAQVPGGTA